MSASVFFARLSVLARARSVSARPCACAFNPHRTSFCALGVVVACAALQPVTSFAQTTEQSETKKLQEVVVTASRTATRIDDLVSEVVVIDRDEIEKSAGRTLTELLARSAGVQFSSNGGNGKSSSIYIRGTEARHTILLIDGVRYGSATLGTPVWENIPLEAIERIEVLKGPGSSLYGSDAAGGVVQIFTRQGGKGFNPHAKVTVGSNSYSQIAAGVSGGAGALNYSVDGVTSRDKGFSATNPAVPFGNYNPDRDGFNQSAVNANLSYKITADWRVAGGALFSDGITRFDDGANRDTRTRVQTQTTNASVEGKVLPGWSTSLRFGQGSDTSHAIVSGFLPGDFKTRQDQWTWQNTVDTPMGVALVGIESLNQSVDSSTKYTVSRRRVSSYFGGINGTFGAHSWQGNIRHDSNSQFGGKTTGFAGYGYKITSALRAHVSHGTSFVAPSFNQLYFPNFGNPLLQPEHGRNTDFGLSYSQAGHSVKVVHFENRIRGFITSTTAPANIPRAKIDGWTLGYDGLIGNFALRAAYDRLDPCNELTGKTLPRRNREQISAGVDYAMGVWNLGASVFRAGSRFDNTTNTIPIAGYTTLDAYVDFKVTREFTIQARGVNLTNKDYQTILGYNQPGRGVFVSLRYHPK
jgi:vitamin B12 transporter